MMEESTALLSQDEPPTLIFDNTSSNHHNIKVYKRRWFMLFVLSLINFSSGTVWMTFGNITDVTSLYYNATTLQVNWLSIVFMLATLVLGLPGIWLLDKYGLRATFFIAALLNSIGTTLRVVSSLNCFHDDKHSAYCVLLIGQIFSGCAQPFFLFSSTKLAADWFPTHQRTLANMAATTANPIGILSGSLLSTLVVTEKNDLNIIQHQMIIMLSTTTVIALFSFLTTLLITTPFPPTPPSFSASERVDVFGVGLKKLFTNKDYLILAVSYGSGVGLLSSLVTITDQLLLPFGYSDKFSGLVTALLFGSGLVGAFGFSSLADRLLRHEVMAKVAYSLGSCFLILFVTLSHYSSLEVYLAIIISAAGIFCLSLNPLCLELAVESSFPVSEATSGGILVLFGQILASLYTFLLSLDSTPSPFSQQHNHQDIISKYGITGYTLVLFVSCILFVVFFKCPCLRKQFEEKKEAERIMRKIRESEELVLPAF